MKQKRLIVIGGGAAGFFCAINAARLNPLLEVIIVERGSKVLQKVKVSGGGRCNTTHACFEIETMASRYPRGERFVKKAFYQFFTTDTVEWFKSRGVELKTEPDGRMFPKANTSQAIIDCLVNGVNKYGVSLRLNMPVAKIAPLASGFHIYFDDNETIATDFVMLACGGFQKLSQFDWLSNLGHTVAEPVPSLFTFNFPNHPLNTLMGVVAPNAMVKIAGAKPISQGPVLITHWGLSGPAILKLSAFAARDLAAVNYQFTVLVNWCMDYNEHSFVQKVQQLRNQSANQKPANGNFTGLPSRLWEFMLQQAGIDDTKRWADLQNAVVNKLSKSICGYEMVAAGKTTFKEEFVTAGGIALNEIDANTMMSKKHPGLYFGGEIMDVDGITGGYNFQHAWTSGFVAAKHIAAQSQASGNS
ncbi:MAG: NAD(P)/FAD-dependent oxidoreductase [Ferruginibacter sp.]